MNRNHQIRAQQIAQKSQKQDAAAHTPMADVIAEVVAHKANSAPSVHVSMIKYLSNKTIENPTINDAPHYVH